MTVTTSRAAASLRELRNRVRTANAGAEEAIAAYEAHKANLQRANPTPSEWRIAKRDDQLLADLASRAEFRTAQAIRLGVALTAELLAQSILDGAQ